MTKIKNVICPKCNKEKEGIFSTYIDDSGRKVEYCMCPPELKLEVEPKSIWPTISKPLVMIVLFGGLIGLFYFGKHYIKLEVKTTQQIAWDIQYEKWGTCTERCADKWKAEDEACQKINNYSEADKCFAKAEYNLMLCHDDCDPLFPELKTIMKDRKERKLPVRNPIPKKL